MGGVLAPERGILVSALLGGERAAGGEAARTGRKAQIGRQARNRVQVLALVLIELGDRGEQCLGVGMADVGEQLAGRGGFDLAAGVHDQHAVGPAGDHAHVVGDQDDPHAKLALDLVEQAEDLGLDGHVERGGRLIGDQQARPAGQRHRDHHPLAHAARELVRIGVGALLGLGDVNPLQHLDRAVPGLLARQALVQRHRLGDLPAHRVERIERGHRLLEDHRDLVAAHPLHVGLGQLEQVPALEADLAADDAPGRVRHQAQDGECRHAFPAPRFADHAQRLAGFQRIAHAVDGPHGADGREEVGLQPVDLQYRRVHARLPGTTRVIFLVHEDGQTI